MEKMTVNRFIYFSLQNDGTIMFNEENAAEFVLPRHPETNDLDVYYLQTMLKYFDPSKEILENEILDAFPVLSLTKDKESKFYKLSIFRLREFYKDLIEEDEYIQASVKHLFMYSMLAKPSNKTLKRVIAGCLDKVTPSMYRPDERDTVDRDKYQLQCLASYVPTSTYKIIKLLKGWIEGALHFYDYSIMFFDHRFVSFDDFSENIIELKTKDLFDPRSHPRSFEIELDAFDHFFIDESGLYYKIPLRIYDIFDKWLFTPPSNDNERDGKVMMFRNNDLKKRLEDILTRFFRKDSFRLNDVFKWNRYLYGGKFDSHYDTMFVQHSSEECSLYTLLVYLDVEEENEAIMYLCGEKEVQVRLDSNTAYIIPHWVRHQVEGEGKREFIKTEIVFQNKSIGTTYDQKLADAFDTSCYYMLHSIRHPELKDIVSQNFNTINEARFYKTVYMNKLINNVFFVKTVFKIPFEYHNTNNLLIKTTDLNFNFITNGTYYYFKTNNKTDVIKPGVTSRNDAIIMLSLLQLDIQPKKMFDRSVRACRCGHEQCIDYYNNISDFDINEEIVYWEGADVERRIADTLQCVQYPSDMGEVSRVGNISISDIHENPETFYFAACENKYPCDNYNESLVTEITSLGRDGNYRSLNVELIGEHKNIIKIRQHSFKNGIIMTRRWNKTP